jgi:hypothetical protein
LAERPPCGGVATLPEDERRRHQRLMALKDGPLGRIRRCIPVVGYVPHGEQTHRVEKNGFHG